MRSTIFKGRLMAAASASVLCLAAAPAHADEAADAEAERERSYAPTDIVVTAHVEGYAVSDGSTALKTPTALIDTPQAVTVITRDQLDDQNVRQLGEALRYVAGISMESGEGHRDEVFIRGQKTTADFFLNGLRDDAQYYRPLYNVERIEVLKGANALTFGRGGGGGIINRVSKTADPDEASVRGNANADTFGGFSVAADANQPFGAGLAGRINTTYEEFASHRDAFDGRFFGIAPTLTARIGPDTRLFAGYTYDDDSRVTDRGIPSLSGKPLSGQYRTFFGDADFNASTAQVHIGRLRIDHDFGGGLSFNASGQFADYDKVYANAVPASTNGTTVDLTGYRDTTRRKNWIGQANLLWQGDTGTIGHTLLAGVETTRQRTNNIRENALFATATGTTSRITVPLTRKLALPAITLAPPLRSNRSALDVFSAYVQEQLEIGEVIQIVGGIRYERFDLDSINRLNGAVLARRDSKWSPRFGVVVKPQQNLSFYASYTQSFLPQAGDQFQLLTPVTAGLDPEKFENIEAGLKWAPRPDLLLTAAVFRLERSNTQAPDPAGSGFTVLTGKSRVDGFEAQLSGNLAANWHVNLGYTFLDGKIRSTTNAAPAGRRMEQVPKHHIAAWTRYDISERLGIGGGVIHSSKQYASVSNAVVLPAYTRVDAAVYYSVSDALSFQVNVENLFDERYYPSAHGDNNIQPARPLAASIGASLTF